MAEERCCLWGEWVVSLVGGLTEVSSPSTNRSVHIWCLDLLVPSWASVPLGLPTHPPLQTTAFPSAAQVLLCPSRTPCLALQPSARLFLNSEIPSPYLTWTIVTVLILVSTNNRHWLPHFSGCLDLNCKTNHCLPTPGPPTSHGHQASRPSFRTERLNPSFILLLPLESRRNRSPFSPVS